MVYGFKKYPLNGPFPKDIGVTENGTGLRIHYDLPILYRNDTENSGFFYCCDDSPCDSIDYDWPVLARTEVTAHEADLAIDVEIGTDLCRGRGFPFWIGYAYANAPFKVNFGGNIYGKNEDFQAPASTWR